MFNWGKWSEKAYAQLENQLMQDKSFWTEKRQKPWKWFVLIAVPVIMHLAWYSFLLTVFWAVEQKWGVEKIIVIILVIMITQLRFSKS